MVGESPNGHVHAESPSIRRLKSTWKVRRNYINFETRIHVEIKTSIRRGSLNVDSTFKIDEISMSSPRGVSNVVLTSNRRNFCTWCFFCIIFYCFLHREFILSYSGIVQIRCDFKYIDVIIDIGTIGTISFGNFAATQINRSKDNFYLVQNNTNKGYNANIYK